MKKVNWSVFLKERLIGLQRNSFKTLNFSFLILITCCYACSSPDAKAPVAAPSKKAAPVADTIAESTIMQAKDLLRDPRLMIPPYGLGKILALTAGIKSVDDTTGDGETLKALDEKTYASLSFDEKFTYHMIHPESYSQMCDFLPEHTDEVHRIYGQLPDLFGEGEWAGRQLEFFKAHRDSVEVLMKALIEKNQWVGANFKEAIVEMNATEMIPYLIATYNKERKDHYILTVLMLLMKKNEDPEFMGSVSYKKLYDILADTYSAHLVCNKANEDLIIQRATNFYNGWSKK